MYLSGYLGAYTTDAFTVPPGSVRCVGGNITISVHNPGTANLGTAAWTTNSIVDANTGSAAPVAALTTANVLAGATTDFRADGETVGERYNVVLGTSAGTQTFRVQC